MPLATSGVGSAPHPRCLRAGVTSGSILADRTCGSVSWSVTRSMRRDSSRPRRGRAAPAPAGRTGAHSPAGKLPAGPRVAVTQVSGRARSPSERPRDPLSSAHSRRRARAPCLLQPRLPAGASLTFSTNPRLPTRALGRTPAGSPSACPSGGPLTVLGFLVCRVRWLSDRTLSRCQ